MLCSFLRSNIESKDHISLINHAFNSTFLQNKSAAFFGDILLYREEVVSDCEDVVSDCEDVVSDCGEIVVANSAFIVFNPSIYLAFLLWFSLS